MNTPPVSLEDRIAFFLDHAVAQFLDANLEGKDARFALHDLAATCRDVMDIENCLGLLDGEEE